MKTIEEMSDTEVRTELKRRGIDTGPLTQSVRDMIAQAKCQIEPGSAVWVVGGKYHGCILTYVKTTALGHRVIIDSCEKTLETQTQIKPYYGPH